MAFGRRQESAAPGSPARVDVAVGLRIIRGGASKGCRGRGSRGDVIFGFCWEGIRQSSMAESYGVPVGRLSQGEGTRASRLGAT